MSETMSDPVATTALGPSAVAVFGERIVLAEAAEGCSVVETVFPDGSHVYAFYRDGPRVAQATTLRALSQTLTA